MIEIENEKLVPAYLAKHARESGDSDYPTFINNTTNVEIYYPIGNVTCEPTLRPWTWLGLTRNKNMFTLSIETENEAFTNDESHEIARILKDLARQVENGKECGVLIDINGNKVGNWSK